MLLICCIVWPLPKIFSPGLPSDNYYKRTIPVTNIAELVEYVLLPHNNEVTKPRALNTFLDGLAELGIDKGLTKNKKLLSDLIEKKKGYRNAVNTSENESNNEDNSSDLEEGRRRKWLLKMGVKLETPKNAATKLSSSLETSTTFHSKSLCEHCEDSNVYGTLVMKCPKGF